MKTMFAVLLTATVLQAAPAFADSPASSPLAGKWAIDVDTLPMPPEARPKSVTLEFHDHVDGKWDTRVNIVNPDGSNMHSEATLLLDGTPGPVTGDYWADVSAMKMPAANVLVLQLAYKGTPSSTRIYTVSEDGKTLTETKAFFSKEGSPMLQTTTFSRIP